MLKLSKRELLSGCGSLLFIENCKAQTRLLSGAYISGTTVVIQGALSGGGYLKAIDISDDGRTRLITYDSSNAWIWNEGAVKWNNILAQNRIPSSLINWGHSTSISYIYTAYSLVCAPSLSTRIYAALYAIPGGGNPISGLIWRSDDRGGTWVDTGYTIPLNLPQSGSADFRGTGPLMAVDPNNPDVLYISDVSGVIHRTFDGGVTWSILNASGNALSGILEETAITANSSTTVLTFGTTPVVVTNKGGYYIFPFNLTRPASITYGNRVLSSNATTVTLSGSVSAAQIGDIVSFGSAAIICFDRSSGTTGGKTNGIYIGWSYGAGAVYHSIDAGATFSATVSGPTRVRHMKCSNDGVLYVCDNSSVTETNTTNAWKYQSGSWTNFSITSFNGNVWCSCAPNPLNAGHVVFMMVSGVIQMSGNYGVTWYPSNTLAPTRLALDVPWMGPYIAGVSGTIENYQSNGSCLFDPIINGRLWIVEGIGCWYCTPPVQTGSIPTITITSQNVNQQGILVDQIIKPPGYPLLIAAQDRSGFKINNVNIEPSKGFQIGESLGAAISAGWAIDYAKNDPSFQICIVGSNAWKSTNAGDTWIQTSTQPPTSHVAGSVAVQSATNFIWFPANDGTPVYTSDGGLTWNSCLFSGTILSTGWAFSLFLNRHNIVADLVDALTYYAYNYSNNANGGIWKSIDGGANWTNVSGGISGLLAVGSQDFQLISVPEFQGHLFFGGGSAFNNNTAMKRSIDGGATWSNVPGTGVCWQPAIGKALLGASYPALYFTGTLNGDVIPGVFRASDISPSNVAAIPTWVRVANAPALNMDTSKSLCADYDVFGSFYIGTGSTGYLYGYLV